jgi:hypothetical protein
MRLQHYCNSDLDANILFSAAKSNGAIRHLLALLREAGHECWVDGFAVEEARPWLPATACISARTTARSCVA